MRTYIFSLILCVSVILTAQAQQYSNLMASVNPTSTTVSNATPNESLKADVPSRDAMFPNGMKAMNDFIKSNNNYKEIANKNFAEGMVTLRFKVNTDGSLSEIRVIKSDNTELNDAAVNIIMAMPNWEPAVSEGYYTARRIVLPIYFKLN